MKRAIPLLLVLSILGTAMGAIPVARWDVIPHQRIKDTFEVGVVAFHENLKCVEFYVNGKKAFTANEPALNSRTHIWEYVYPLDASKYPDGKLTLTAKAIAEDGGAKVLPELELFANHGDSLGSKNVVWIDPKNGNDFSTGTKERPVSTFKAAFARVKDGGTIMLNKGMYDGKRMGGKTKRTYWTTIRPAPGLKRGDVKISGGRIGVDKVRFFGVDLYCDIENDYGAVIVGEGGETSCWLDSCRIYNRKGSKADTHPFGNKMVAYVTGGATVNMGNGPRAEIVRSHQVINVSHEAFSGENTLIVNCRAVDVTPGEGGDVSKCAFYQSAPRGKDWNEDVIVYNVSGFNLRGRGIAGSRLKNSAFVNLCLVSEKSDGNFTRFQGAMENVIFAQMTIVNMPWIWHDEKGGESTADFFPRDVRVYNSVFERVEGFNYVNGTRGLKFSHNIINGIDPNTRTPCQVYGEESVFSPRNFKDELNRNFALGDETRSKKFGMPFKSIPVDINGEAFGSDRACGAYSK